MKYKKIDTDKVIREVMSEQHNQQIKRNHKGKVNKNLT